jgi:CHAT domain-containing protein
LLKGCKILLSDLRDAVFVPTLDKHSEVFEQNLCARRLLAENALSLFDAGGRRIDGFLRANDVLRIDLNADLIALSSCRSGVGKQIKGEGMISLANSFFASGARRMLASLWNVEDKAAAEFMTRFYEKHLKGKKSFSAALRETQIEIMRDRRWRAPFYWAPFVLHGN